MSRAKNRLRAAGIAANEVSASRFMHVPLSSLWIAPKGHALHDPRSLDPVDQAMADNMAERVAAGECPNTNAILVLEDGKRLIVGDGHGRTAAMRAAASEADRAGSEWMPLVEFFSGTEAEFLLERMRRNDHGRFARADRVSVLAFRVKQLTSAGVEIADILAACPKGVDKRAVDALSRWGNVAADLRPRFDSGEIPIGLLAAILEHERAEQPAAADRLLAAGVKTSRQAARQATKAKAKADPWGRPMTRKALVRMADHLGSDATVTAAVARSVAFQAGVREGVEQGLRIAACQDIPGVLDLLPGDVADAIRAARMGAK